MVLLDVGWGECIVTSLKHRLAGDLCLPRSVGDLRPCGVSNKLAGTGLVPVPELILQSCYKCRAWGVSLVNCFCTEEAEVGNFVQQLIKDTPLPSVARRVDWAHFLGSKMGLLVACDNK